jgi:hyaluronate lyase
VLDTYLAAAMTVSGAASDLTGYASWFCFDDYVLALGTGLSSDAAEAVETTVENRLFHPGSFGTLTVDGEPAVGEPGDTRTWRNPGWAHLEGVGGYVFLGAAAVRAEHQQRSGSWADVNEAGSTEAVTRTYVSIVIDHGARPSAASYAYLVVPGATAAETAALAGRRDVWVGAARPGHHLVSQDGSGITMATFWQPGAVPGLRSDAPCSVVARESDDGLTVAVADLARRAAPIRLVLSGKGRLRPSDADESFTVRSVGSDLEVTVRPATAGGTVVARLRES